MAVLFGPDPSYGENCYPPDDWVKVMIPPMWARHRSSGIAKKGYDTFCDRPRNHNLGTSLNTRQVGEHVISWRANRPLGALKEFFTTMATDINDLSATSPHGSDSDTIRKFLDLHLIPAPLVAQRRHTVKSGLRHPTPQIWRLQMVGYFAVSRFS